MTAETSHPQHDIISLGDLARCERGLEVVRSVSGKATQVVIGSLADIDPALAHHIAVFGFGDVYSRPDLDPRSRQLITIDALTALGDCELRLRIHIETVLNVGLTREEIVEVILHVSAYAGFPRTLNVTLTIRKVSVERDVTD